jgi:L-lactate dehydrogenase complex protein LldE
MIALFIPCYVRELYPEVIKATILLLNRLNIKFDIPKFTCCGQPFVNSGESTKLHKKTAKIFNKYDEIIAIGSSCVSFLKSQNVLKDKLFELSEYLYNKGYRDLAKNYPKKIAFHHSCHSIRHLKNASASELNISHFDKIQELLGCKLLFATKDECCGFGGVFSLKEGFISYVMGREKLDDLLSQNPDIISGVDMSCLMHLKGIADKDGDKVEFKHISEIILESLDNLLYKEK